MYERSRKTEHRRIITRKVREVLRVMGMALM